MRPLFILYRRFSAAVTAITLCVSLIGIDHAYPATSQGKSPPNVILISIDTLRADHLSCYDYKRNTSPNIDTLAKDGILFLDAFSQSPKTTPSHMSIMTSLYPEVHGVKMWRYDKDKKKVVGKRLDDSIPTIAEVLKTNGYITVAFTDDGHVAASRGFDKGFDIYEEYQRYSDSGLDGIKSAVSWLDKNHQKRFFLFFHSYFTHDPYFSPAPYCGMYYPNYSGSIVYAKEEVERMITVKSKKKVGEETLRDAFWKNVHNEDPSDIELLKALYDGAIRYTDEQIIGRLLRKVKELGIYNNTIIIFTSDHGEAFYERKHFLHDDLYKETLHVPLILVYPDLLPKNTKIERLVQSVDIMPTILDILKIEHSLPMQGKSLMKALTEEETSDIFCYSSFSRKRFTFQSLRTDNYAYIYYDNPGIKKTFTKLYDRKNDPREMNNIKENKPQIVAAMERRLRAIVEYNTTLYPRSGRSEKKGSPDTKTIETLKSLGYL